MASEKVAQIFRELVGKRADRLNGTKYLADVNDRIAKALGGERDPLEVEQMLRHDEIGFHLIDWQNEAAFIVALALFPERFTDEEIRDGVESFLLHAPAHVLEAARLRGYQTENIFHRDPDSAV